MKFLADENFPGLAVRALREAGFDVAYVREDAPGATDEALLTRCASEGLILLTMDKDFGELTFSRGIRGARGILLFRVQAKSPEDLTATILGVIQSRIDWEDHFSVIGKARIRMTPLPNR